MTTPASTTTVDFVLSSVGTTDLFAARAQLVELRLERDDGSLTENLLTTGISLELVHLQEVASWLARRAIEPGDYAAVIARFASPEASGSDGDALDVTLTNAELRAEFLLPLEISDQPYERFTLNFVLQASLIAGPGENELSFEPRGVTDVDTGLASMPVQNVLARVMARDTGTSTITLDLFADQELQASIGSLTADVLDNSLMVNPVGFVETLVPYYLTYMTAGVTIVDVHGELGANGAFTLSGLEIEEQNGSVVLPRFPLKLEGRIVEVTSPAVFRMQVRNVRRGDSIMMPLDGAPIVDIAIDPPTVLVSDVPDLMPPSSLTVGLDVEVKSEQLSLAPILAVRVEAK